MENEFFKNYLPVGLWIGNNIKHYINIHSHIMDAGKLSVDACNMFSGLDSNHIRDIIAVTYIKILSMKITGEDKSWTNN